MTAWERIPDASEGGARIGSFFAFPSAPVAGEAFETAAQFTPAGFAIQSRLSQLYRNSLESRGPAGAQGVYSAGLESQFFFFVSPVGILLMYAPEMNGLVNPYDLAAFLKKKGFPDFLTDREKLEFLKLHNKAFNRLVSIRHDLTYKQALFLLNNEVYGSSLQAEVLIDRPDISYQDLEDLMRTVAAIIAPINPEIVAPMQNEACQVLLSYNMSPVDLIRIYDRIAFKSLDPGQIMGAFSQVLNGSIRNLSEVDKFFNPVPNVQSSSSGGIPADSSAVRIAGSTGGSTSAPVGGVAQSGMSGGGSAGVGQTPSAP